jgi:arylsulfatase A-like enzyme
MRKRNIFYLLSAFCLLSSNTVVLNAAKREKPNVIIIYADDLGKGMISAYGQKQFTTPAIDRLIHNGVSFSRAYGGANSNASRASLLTGYHNCNKMKWRINLGGLYYLTDTAQIAHKEELIDRSDIIFPATDLYLPQVFTKAGYVAGQIGMLGWGGVATRQQMKVTGWDYWFGYLDHVRSNGYYPPFLFENDRIVMIEGNSLIDCGRNSMPENDAAFQKRHNTEGKQTYAPQLFIDKALEFIRTFKDTPFFLLYSTQLPHGPVATPYIDPEIEANEALSAVEKEYATMVKILDNQVQSILAELQSLGIDENTIIVFSSDNGHEIYYRQEGRFDKPYRNMSNMDLFDGSYSKYYGYKAGDVFNGNGVLAGLKPSNLEGGVCVPLVWYQKGHTTERTTDQVVAAYDLLPTFADMLNIKLNEPKNGTSILQMIDGKHRLPSDRYVIIASEDGPALIMNDGWKLRYYNKNKTYELYNLKKDIEEKYNVILRYPDKAEELKKLLLKECENNINFGILME